MKENGIRLNMTEDNLSIAEDDHPVGEQTGRRNEFLKYVYS